MLCNKYIFNLLATLVEDGDSTVTPFWHDDTALSVNSDVTGSQKFSFAFALFSEMTDVSTVEGVDLEWSCVLFIN